MKDFRLSGERNEPFLQVWPNGLHLRNDGVLNWERDEDNCLNLNCLWKLEQKRNIDVGRNDAL